ncbi:conserved hypothetical protein [Neospora caninum Liverpool]|uniref:Transmembrane protein n=1 Tax=Neospora caninum (strain Liverpool) TaxID=572307 RepID=F0VDI2_NEOCL|nr:conserved hypothetical protein [Neospora caninum Liverpool]CBZ51775.1 conserved hypothetical protein [Neospora caninum Liverpool]CEL65732.1 TPA: hypothetical protein BN1204_015670 [Neospora caninum Liverpool]|eukprot:XP_003881808.1 conserved hypothetical protein [Neospora caninum Liverpool]
MRMQWFLLRHAYFIKGEDFAVAVALLDLALYVLIGTNSLQFLDQAPEKAMFGMVTSALIFIIALCGFVIVRMFRTSKYKIETYIMPVLIICNIASIFYMQLINKLVGFMTLQLPVLTFLVTGYPYVWLVAFVLIGMGGGLIAQSVVCSISLGTTCPPSVWIDVGLYALQLVSGSVAYFTVYELGILIVRYKRHPARYLDAFSDLTALDTIVFSPVFGLGGETARQVQVSQLMAPEKPNLDGLTFLRSASQVSQTTNRLVSRTFYHANTPPHIPSRDGIPGDKALVGEKDRAGSAVFSVPNGFAHGPGAPPARPGLGAAAPHAGVAIPKTIKQHAAALHAGGVSPHGSPSTQPLGPLAGVARPSTARGCSGYVSLSQRDDGGYGDLGCGSVRTSVESRATNRSAAIYGAQPSARPANKSGRVAGLFRNFGSKRSAGSEGEGGQPPSECFASAAASKDFSRKKGVGGSASQSTVPILFPRPCDVEGKTWEGLPDPALPRDLAKETPAASFASSPGSRVIERHDGATEPDSDAAREAGRKAAAPLVAEATVHKAVRPSASFCSDVSSRSSFKAFPRELQGEDTRDAHAGAQGATPWNAKQPPAAQECDVGRRAGEEEGHREADVSDESGLPGAPALPSAEARVRSALQYHRRWFFSQLLHFRRARRRQRRRGSGSEARRECSSEEGDFDSEGEGSCNSQSGRSRKGALRRFSRRSGSRLREGDAGVDGCRGVRSSDEASGYSSSSRREKSYSWDEGSESDPSGFEETRRRHRGEKRYGVNRRRSETSSDESVSSCSTSAAGRYEGEAAGFSASTFRRFFPLFAPTGSRRREETPRGRLDRERQSSCEEGSQDCSASSANWDSSEASADGSDASCASSSLCDVCERGRASVRRSRRHGTGQKLVESRFSSRSHSPVPRKRRGTGHVSVDLTLSLPSHIFFDTFLNSVRKAEQLSKGRLPAAGSSSQPTRGESSVASLLSGGAGDAAARERPEDASADLSSRTSQGWERYYGMLLPSLPPFPCARPLSVKSRNTSQGFQRVDAPSASRKDTEETAASLSSRMAPFFAEAKTRVQPPAFPASAPPLGATRITSLSPERQSVSRGEGRDEGSSPSAPQSSDSHRRLPRRNSLSSSFLTFPTCPQPPSLSPSSPCHAGPQASRSTPERTIELGSMERQAVDPNRDGSPAPKVEREPDSPEPRGCLTSPSAAPTEERGRSWSSCEARASLEVSANPSKRTRGGNAWRPVASATHPSSNEKVVESVEACAQVRCRRCGCSRSRVPPRRGARTGSGAEDASLVCTEDGPERRRLRRRRRRDRRRARAERRRRRARRASEEGESERDSSGSSRASYSSAERRSHRAVGGVAQLTPICVDDECGRGDAILSPLLRSEAESESDTRGVWGGSRRWRRAHGVHDLSPCSTDASVAEDSQERSEEEREGRSGWMAWLLSPWGDRDGGEKRRRKRSRSEGRRDRAFIRAERRYLEAYRKGRASAVADTRRGSGESEASADVYPFSLRRRKGSRVHPASASSKRSSLRSLSQSAFGRHSWLAVVPPADALPSAALPSLPTPSPSSLSFSGLDREMDYTPHDHVLPETPPVPLASSLSSSLPGTDAGFASVENLAGARSCDVSPPRAHFAADQLHRAEQSDAEAVSPAVSPRGRNASPMSAAGMPNPDSGSAAQAAPQRPLLLAQSLVAAGGKAHPRADLTDSQRSQDLSDVSGRLPSHQSLPRSAGHPPMHPGLSMGLEATPVARPSRRLSTIPSTRHPGSAMTGFPQSSFSQGVAAVASPRTVGASRESRTFAADGAARASRTGLSSRHISHGASRSPLTGKGTRRLKSGYSVGATEKDKQKGKMLKYQLVQKFHDRLPWWVARIIVYTDAALENCRRRRRLMQRATWKNKVAMPVRNMLGLFSDEKIETWYVQWLNAFNAKYYPRIAWLLFLICVYATAFHGLLRVRGFIENYPLCMDAVRASRLGEAGFLMLVAFRFASQPILSFLLLLPLLRHSGSKLIECLTCSRSPTTPPKSYKLYRWMIALSFVQFVYAVFDNTWHLIAAPSSRHINPLTIIPASPSLEIAAVQTVYILAVRTPTINLIFLLYIITYLIVFFVVLPPAVQQMQLFTISIAGWLFTCVGGQLFYTRAFEVNRRRLFCKYVLPYMLYLEEIAAILYSNAQGEYPLDEGSEDEMSMGSTHLIVDRS